MHERSIERRKVQCLHLEAIKTSSTSLICFSHLRALLTTLNLEAEVYGNQCSKAFL